MHLGTEQELGGIDGAGSENHVGCIERERVVGNRGGDMPAVDAPTAVGELLDPFDFRLRENIRAIFRRQRQIVHIEGVLRREVTARYAIAAFHAGPLQNALRVGSVVLEIHRKVEGLRDGVSSVARFCSACTFNREAASGTGSAASTPRTRS